MTEQLVILGVDPGLANCGWGVIAQQGSQLKAVAYGCISTPASEPIPARLATIHRELTAAIVRYQPEELGIETIWMGVNTSSAMATAQARGAALVACAIANLIVGEYSPATIKSSLVGNGSASKEQIQFMVKRILALDHTPHPDHCADALAAAICHSTQRARHNLDVL